ncbi:LuxR C-terminal-related transcriptional regulator [Scrofimicrobium canadense]|uniref:LuxR C-terminal-related transcriptional regulator n=1 Tax=Scrofimicrobium canadense TaxID=2652290 RepID=UPI00384AE378
MTLREAEVLQVLIGGCTIEDASAQMGISAGTIRNYVSAAMDKTGARTRAEAARIAQEKGWLDP